MALGAVETATEGTEAVVEVEVSGTWMKMGLFPCLQGAFRACLGAASGVLYSRSGPAVCKVESGQDQKWFSWVEAVCLCCYDSWNRRAQSFSFCLGPQRRGSICIALGGG
jgi:hypothetical protein